MACDPRFGLRPGETTGKPKIRVLDWIPDLDAQVNPLFYPSFYLLSSAWTGKIAGSSVYRDGA
jgi:hypothetical protein